MANKLYEESNIQLIADGIRRKNRLSNTMVLSEMPFAISEADTSPYGKMPSYWKESVGNVISTINNLVASDKNYIPLGAYFSDMHVSYKYSPNQGYTGILSAMVMNATQMPFALCTGDISASGGNGFTKESEMVDCFEDVNDILAPIGWNRLLLTQGNHDGSWGTYDGKAYAYQMSPSKLYDYMYRKLDKTNHIFGGGDNSYYYVDYPENKIRIIMLNSLWCETSENSNGTAVYDRQHYFGFGQAQLSWLANTALNFTEEGWTVLLATHVPPIDKYNSNYRDMTILHGILTAFCEKTSYTGSRTYNSGRGEGTWANVSISVDFSDKKTGIIAGFFCGHVHKDTIDTAAYRYPIITITADADIPYDETEEDRIAGSDNEHAIDFITINTTKQEVVLTRLGVGSSRVYSYDGTILYAITNNLTNVTTNNGIASIERGLPYTATLTVKENCELETLTVTMGGVDITSSVYNSSIISIAEVTGNIIITAKAKAIPKPVTYVDKMSVQSSNLNKRISGTNIAGTSGAGCFIADRIEVDLTQECPVIFKNFAPLFETVMGSSVSNYGNSKVALLDASGNCLAVWYISKTIPTSSANSNHWLCPINGNDCIGDLSTIFDTTPVSGTKPSSGDVKYVVFSPHISSSTITMDNLSGLEIQMVGE